MVRQVFMIAGMGVNAKNYAPFSMLRDSLSDHPSSFHFIDGAVQTEAGLMVATPSEQYQEIQQKMENAMCEKTLFVTQCAGVIAAMQCLEDDPSRTRQLLAIAPPIPDPYRLMKYHAIRRRLRVDSSGISVPSYSFGPSDNLSNTSSGAPTYLPIPPRYFNELHEISPDFAKKVKKLNDLNLLSIVVPSLDWNPYLHPLAAELKNTLTVVAPHSLYGKADEMEVTCQSISAHILNLTSDGQIRRERRTALSINY